MRFLSNLLLAALVVACAPDRPKEYAGYDPSPGFEQLQRNEYRKGQQAAAADLKNGVLAYEDVQGGEEERWRVLWCYRKILKERHGVEYRIISSSSVPGPLARAAGYQEIVRPVIDKKLGKGWQERIYEEAEDFHRHHWKEVVDLYQNDP